MADVTDTWSSSELDPYRQLIGEGAVDAVMTAHVYHRDLDPDHPATLSKSIIGDLLRDQLHFKGVVVSDDMQMVLSQIYGLEEALRLAITAGVDLIALANNTLYERDIAALRIGYCWHGRRWTNSPRTHRVFLQSYSASARGFGNSAMRMQIPFLFALLAWLGCSGDTPTNHGEAGQPLRVEWEEGDVIVAMGTSLTFGYGSGGGGGGGGGLQSVTAAQSVLGRFFLSNAVE